LISENKKERLEKIIIEAVEQSERNKIPKLEFLEKLDFGNLRESENIFCHPSPPTPSPNGRGGEKQLPNNIKIKNLKLDFKKSVNLFI
jgi:RsmE family RNA methyltransferase